LQALTRLVDLRLSVSADSSVEEMGSRVTASMLACMHNLTCLQLSTGVEVEPGALAGKTNLRHLDLHHCRLPGRRRCSAAWAVGASQLLSHLQQLQQLTHLNVTGTLRGAEADPPAAAYSALTASSTLQHLTISTIVLPPAAWQHMFPVGRQLPHLRYLDTSAVVDPSQDYSFAAAPDFSSLVGCCPRLQVLHIQHRLCNTQLLAPLRGLTGLRRLEMGGNQVTADDLQAVSQLTGIRELSVLCLNIIEAELLLPLLELQQLTTCHLCVFFGQASGHDVKWTSEVGSALLSWFIT
jgi:hypothetical protein